MLLTIAFGIYAAALIAAAVNDLARYEIPNVLSVALVAAFLPIALTQPVSLSAWHALAGAATFLVATFLFAAGICGGGDVKLLGATALWVGWGNLPDFLLVTALAGGALALLILVARKLAAPERRFGHWYSQLLQNNAGVPYGVAIAVAGLVLSQRFADASFIGGN
jgi:prepilin peptidase CpaA